MSFDVKQTNVLLSTLSAPLRKGTDTVYSELKNLPHGEFHYIKMALINIETTDLKAT